MLPSQTVTLTIPRNWLDLYETIWKPKCFAKWASGLSSSTLTQEGQYWKAKGPEGTVKIYVRELGETEAKGKGAK